MHYRSFVFVSCVVVLLLSSFSFAQEATPGDEDGWGKQQRVQEMLDYWRSWDMSGPDTNISVARDRGMKQFLSMNRPPAFKQVAQSSPAWEYVATSQFGGAKAVSGRGTDIAFDPRPEFEQSTLYFAASGGGLWKTINANEADPSQIKWVPISNSFGSYAMGAVAVHPLMPEVVFAATGDLHGGDGDGLYKSTDGGLNWVKIVPHTGATGISPKSNQLLFNPLNPQHMYHTGATAIRKSYDGGYTWDNVQNIGSLGAATHMVVDPTDTNRLYVAGGGKIIRSTDGGATWSTDRASNITGKGRITLGFSPADPSKVYASIVGSNAVSIGSAVSTDYGETWKIVDQQDYTGEQGFYNNACVASPTKPNTMFVAGLDIYRSQTGGTNLAKKSNWLAKNGDNNYTHADVHVLKYSPSGSKLYALTDGGLFVSGDDGSIWKSLNNDLGTLQFVGADAAPDMSYVIGGCQDNGNNRAEAGQRTFDETDGGDGGRTFVAQNDPSIVYSTYYGASLKRSNTYGESWVSIVRPGDGSALGNEGTPFYMNYDVSESDASYMAVCGNKYVYYSTDGGMTLNKITTTSIGPKAVHVTAGDPSYLYVGTAGGYVYTTPDGGESWVKSETRVGSSGDFGDNTFANFVSDPSNHMRAWTVTAGFGGKKFWLTEDGGFKWTAPATNLPNLSMQTIARAPNGDLFIGHAYGVMRSIDNGVTWEPLRDGLPLCNVRKLQVRNGHLIAATYGRSIWKININELPRTIDAAVTHTEDPNFKIASIMPNPVRSIVEMNYKISADSKVMIRLYDELGREVKLLANEFSYAGEHTLRTNLSDVPSGSYFIVLTANGRAITEELVINR